MKNSRPSQMKLNICWKIDPALGYITYSHVCLTKSIYQRGMTILASRKCWKRHTNRNNGKINFTNPPILRMLNSVKFSAKIIEQFDLVTFVFLGSRRTIQICFPRCKKQWPVSNLNGNGITSGNVKLIRCPFRRNPQGNNMMSCKALN